MSKFLNEILEQPKAVLETIKRYEEDGDILFKIKKEFVRRKINRITFSGMGSSLYANYPASYFLSSKKIHTQIFDASEFLHHHLNSLNGDDLVVLVSQSGESIEVRRILKKIGKRIFTIGVTNEEKSFLARKSDFSLITLAGEEEGVTSKTYTSTIAVLLLFSYSITSNLKGGRFKEFYKLSLSMQDFLNEWEEKIKEMHNLLGEISCITLLGRGSSLSSVFDGALILQEAARVQAQGLSCGLFRHGPLELVDENFKSIVFATQDRTYLLTLNLVKNILNYGGKIVMISNRELKLNSSRILNIKLGRTSEFLSPILEIIPIQLFAYSLGTRKGFKPGRLFKTSKVCKTE